jgi:diguanylate cyclase (GGDEF)-like protein
MKPKLPMTVADKHINYLKSEKHLNPLVATLKIIIIYLLMGFLWIFVSDELLAIMVTNPQTFQRFQTFKGWFYVLITALIFYFIIHNQMKKYVEKIFGLDLAYLELDKAHQELLSFERQLHLVAYYDEMTGLPSKSSLIKKTRQLSNHYQNNNKPYAFLYVDVDDFRHINEMYGYDEGDKLLVEIAKVFQTIIKEPNYVTRFSEDEFIILILDVATKEEALHQAETIIENLHKDYSIHNTQMKISFSAGVSIYPDHGNDYMSLLRSADTALLHAKNTGKNKVSLFEADMYLKRTHQIEMLQSMKGAIENKEFMLYFQPIFDLRTDTIVSAEALIRWTHAVKGFISPMEFIPLAELTGLIHDINDWVFVDAFDTHNTWKKTSLKNLNLSINVSAKSLTNQLFISKLKNLCLEKNIKCESFTLEITETAMIEDIKTTETTLNELSQMGFEIALDDFGTGYSSLTYLKRLPIDVIKIDRAFISDCIEISNDKDTLQYIINLAHHLEMTVVAEGVETKEQLELLKSLGCDYAQGYYLGRPMPVDQLIKTINKSN